MDLTAPSSSRIAQIGILSSTVVVQGQRGSQGRKVRAMENQNPQATLAHDGYFVNPIRYEMPLKLFTSGIWAGLTPPARAVLPVIAVHTNKEQVAFPGMKTISEFSGYRDLPTVKDGINFLRAQGLIEKERVGRHNQYLLKETALYRGGTYFSMWRQMFEAHVWSGLVPCEQALWPLLGVKAKMDPKAEREAEPFEHGKQRFYPKALLEMSGLSRMSFYRSLKGLCGRGLITFSSKYAGEPPGYNPGIEYDGNDVTVYYLPTALREAV